MNKNTDNQKNNSNTPIEIWTIKEIINWTSNRFHKAGFDTPLLDAQLLLCEVLKFDKVKLYTNWERPLTLIERDQFRALVQRRLKGEPVAYLTNKKHWHTLELYIDNRVLIPRPETELILDFVFSLWDKLPSKPEIIVDLCTGSGCLAIALAQKFTSAKIFALDISQDALDVAQLNAKKHNVDNIIFIQQDVTDKNFFSSFLDNSQKIDILVANPPYVSEQEWNDCSESVRNFEPRLALIAQDNGLDIGKKIFAECVNNNILNNNSCFAMELGTDFSNTICNNDTIMSFQQPTWCYPRDTFFGLRDLSAKNRFLCAINGLTAMDAVPLISAQPD